MRKERKQALSPWLVSISLDEVDVCRGAHDPVVALQHTEGAPKLLLVDLLRLVQRFVRLAQSDANRADVQALPHEVLGEAFLR